MFRQQYKIQVLKCCCSFTQHFILLLVSIFAFTTIYPQHVFALHFYSLCITLYILCSGMYFMGYAPPPPPPPPFPSSFGIWGLNIQKSLCWLGVFILNLNVNLLTLFFYLLRVILDERFVHQLHIFMLFPVGGGNKKFEDWGLGGRGGRRGLKILGLGGRLPVWRRGYFCWEAQYPITWHVLLLLPLSHSHHYSNLQ